LTVACPAKVILILPKKVHKHLEELFKAGIFPIRTVGEPGAQGVAVAGTQGIGVKTPWAAVVALAVAGKAKERHKPKGIIFTIGL
jgi:hypothetical protein